MFGLPWYAIVALAGIIGGLFYAYKEQELKLEKKQYARSNESQELRKMILNLKARVEHLEEKIQNYNSAKAEIPLDDIEIKDDYYSDETNKNSSTRIKN